MQLYKDFIVKMTEMTKAELFIINLIAVQWVPNTSIGEAAIKPSSFSSADSNKFANGIKLLVAKDIVRKTRQSHYILHPNALPPRDKELALEIWETL